MSENLLPFKISSGLKNIIGRDLITDDYIAVFELVKNAYDANASHVFIEFSDDKIIILDNGKGMSKEDIVEKWLFVAYSAKKEGIEDTDENTQDFRDKIQLKRYYAGAKGIGRFSCDRLGNKLMLTTRKKDGSTTERIKVNWNDFDQDASTEFIKINVKHQTLLGEHKFAKGVDHGTRLVITNLNEKWERSKKIGLKKSLAKLINPFDPETVKDIENATQPFSIIINDDSEKEEDEKNKNDYDQVNGEVKNFIFEKLNLKTSHITATIDENGKGITIKLVDRGTLIYKIRKPNSTVLKDVVFHLFFLNQAAKNNFTKTVGIRAIDFGSIYLYKNGFRISPYGDPGDDSFRVDSRHGQNVGRTFGLRDLVGRIEIFGDERNEMFKETTNRNGGLIKNEYTDALIDCFTDNCLRKLEAYVLDIARKTTQVDDKIQEDTSHLENLRSQNEIFKLIRKEIEKGNGELEELDKNFIAIKAQALGEATKEAIENLRFLAEQYNEDSFLKYVNQTSTEFEQIQAEKEALSRQLKDEEIERKRAEEEKNKLEFELRIEQEKNTYLLATRRVMSKDADGLIHNIKFMANKIKAIIDNTVNKLKDGNAREDDILKQLSNIRILADRSLKITELVTRANFNTTVQTQVVDVVKFTEQYFSLFNEIYEKHQMEFDVVTKNASLERRIGVLDLSLVFDNFIFNAEKAGASKMLIECSTTPSESLIVKISDNGHGVKEQFLDNPEKMFELGVTTTNGSGIGLFSIRENLRSINAKARFLGNNQILSGATFEIAFL
jgi:signal transduction histidine kinase